MHLPQPKPCYIVWNEPLQALCFNQRGDISILNGSSLKLVDKVTYLGSSVSSTKTDIEMRLAKDSYQSDFGHMEVSPDR